MGINQAIDSDSLRAPLALARALDRDRDE